MKELVVALYKENIDWLDSIHSFDKKTVYNKGDKVVESSIILPNIGREAHTFLHHIVTNYDNLADFTVFLQGNPFDATIDVDSSNIGQKFSDYNFNENVCEPVFFPRHRMVWDYTGFNKKCYAIYFQGEIPEIYFSPGAQWIAPKTNILNRSLNFYKHMLQEVSTHYEYNQDGAVNPWSVESMWNYIFDKNLKAKYFDSCKTINCAVI